MPSTSMNGMRGAHARVIVADRADGDDRHVIPGTDQEATRFARFRRFALVLIPSIVAQRSAEKDVVPGAELRALTSRSAIAVFDTESLPVVVIFGMGEPVVIVRSEVGQGRDHLPMACDRTPGRSESMRSRRPSSVGRYEGSAATRRAAVSVARIAMVQLRLKLSSNAPPW